MRIYYGKESYKAKRKQGNNLYPASDVLVQVVTAEKNKEATRGKANGVLSIPEFVQQHYEPLSNRYRNSGDIGCIPATIFDGVLECVYSQESSRWCIGNRAVKIINHTAISWR